VIFRRARFRDVVVRQLELFAEDEADLLRAARDADSAWSEAGAEDSEELYGDYQLVADEIGERLYDLRETYAGALDANAAEEYRAEFDRAARKRFRTLAMFLEGS
jgi:hypothetical protein